MGDNGGAKYCILLALVFSILSSCGGNQVQKMSAGEIIQRSGERMQSLEGFEYSIQRTGALVYLDYEQTIGFSRAEGQFEAPDHVTSKVRVILPGMITDVSIVSINGVQWNTNFLSGEWEQTDPNYSFNPSDLFDSGSGIQVILANDMVNPLLTGTEELEEVPGKKLYALEATLKGEHIYYTSYGLIDNEDLKIKCWIDPKTFDLYRVYIDDPANPGSDEDTFWQIDFWNFGIEYDIEPPVIE